MNHKCYNAHTGLNVYRQDTFISSELKLASQHLQLQTKCPCFRNLKIEFILVTGCWEGPLQWQTIFTCPFFILTDFLASCSSVLGTLFHILDGTFGNTDRVRKNVSQLSIRKLVTWSVSLVCSIRLRFVVLMQLTGFGIIYGAISRAEIGTHTRNRAKGISMQPCLCEE